MLNFEPVVGKPGNLAVQWTVLPVLVGAFVLFVGWSLRFLLVWWGPLGVFGGWSLVVFACLLGGVGGVLWVGFWWVLLVGPAGDR